jgi:hypothetical protein
VDGNRIAAEAADVVVVAEKVCCDSCSSTVDDASTSSHNSVSVISFCGDWSRSSMFSSSLSPPPPRRCKILDMDGVPLDCAVVDDHNRNDDDAVVRWVVVPVLDR